MTSEIILHLVVMAVYFDSLEKQTHVSDGFDNFTYCKTYACSRI